MIRRPLWQQHEHRLVIKASAQIRWLLPHLLPDGEMRSGWWWCSHPREAGAAGYRVLVDTPAAGAWWRDDGSGGGATAVSLIASLYGMRRAGSVKMLAVLLGDPFTATLRRL